VRAVVVVSKEELATTGQRFGSIAEKIRLFLMHESRGQIPRLAKAAGTGHPFADKD